MEDRLATRDDVLRRRASVAWRSSVALGAGAVAVLLTFLWGWAHPELGNAVAALIGRIDWGGLVDAVCPVCKPFTSLPLPTPPEQLSPDQLSHTFALGYLLVRYVVVGVFATGALALAIGGVVTLAVGQLVAAPSPYAYPDAPAVAGGVRAVFVLPALSLGLGCVASFVFARYISGGITYNALTQTTFAYVYIWSLGLAELLGVIAFIAGLVDMVESRQWGWIAAVALATLATVTYDPFYRSALLSIALIGCLIILRNMAEMKRWRWFWALVLVAFMLVYGSLSFLLSQSAFLTSSLMGAGAYVDPVIPIIIYALWAGPAQFTVRRRVSAAQKSVLALAVVTLALVVLAYGPHFTQIPQTFQATQITISHSSGAPCNPQGAQRPQGIPIRGTDATLPPCDIFSAQ